MNFHIKEMDWHQNCCNAEQQKLEIKTMHKDSGFSLIEVMTVIALIAVMAGIAVPLMMGSRSGANLRGAVENLRGDLQLAKMKAVQESWPVAVLFSDKRYHVFIDEDIDGVHDSGERSFKIKELPAGVSIDLGSTDFNGNVYARFNSRGLPEDPGKVVVVSSGGDGRRIELNRLGRISIHKE